MNNACGVCNALHPHRKYIWKAPHTDARVPEKRWRFVFLEIDVATIHEAPVEREIPEGIPTVHLSPCNICNTVPFTSENRRSTQNTSQTHRKASKAERLRAREEAGNATDEALDEGIDPLVRISRSGISDVATRKGQRR